MIIYFEFSFRCFTFWIFLFDLSVSNFYLLLTILQAHFNQKKKGKARKVVMEVWWVLISLLVLAILLQFAVLGAPKSFSSSNIFVKFQRLYWLVYLLAMGMGNRL